MAECQTLLSNQDAKRLAEAAVSEYLAAYGVRDLGALVEAARECATGHGWETEWAEAAAAVREALTTPLP